MKFLFTFFYLSAIIAIGTSVHTVRPVRMFPDPCTFADSVKQLMMTAKNVTHCLEEIGIVTNGNEDFQTKLKADMKESVKAIDSTVSKLNTLSLRYEDCCQLLQSVYSSYHRKTIFTEDQDGVSGVINHYRDSTVRTFTPVGGRIDKMNKILTSNQAKMEDLLDKLMAHGDAQHKTILTEWEAVMKDIQTERDEARTLIRSAVCLKPGLFNQEIQSKAGTVACAGCIPYKSIVGNLVHKIRR